LGIARLAGGNWDNGVYAGSRAVNVNNVPWNVNSNIGCRFACDFTEEVQIIVSEQTITVTKRVRSKYPGLCQKREDWSGCDCSKNFFI
jgi:hypothetical protein